IVRELVYAPYVGDLTAHQLSTIIAIAAYGGLVYAMLSKEFLNASQRTLWMVGVLWVVMTVTFEFSFGYYVDGASWMELIGDYNLFRGNVWGLFLVFILIIPHLVKRLAQKLQG
ncbi:MAG TPA: hypothetical protein VGE31_00170, partial [Candidatus Paceibacterota bacterium]